MKVAIWGAFFLIAVSASVYSQAGNKGVPNPVSVNECFAKGGIGIITTSLYIDLRSDRNRLVLAEGKEWIGQGAALSETVVVFRGRVWSGRTPDGFDLSKATIISFEKERVRFFDFNSMEGGFYRR